MKPEKNILSNSQPKIGGSVIFVHISLKKPASLNIECIANAHVIEMNWSDLDWIYTRFPSIETFQKGNLEKHLISLNTRIQSQLELGAEKRFLKFILDYPKVAEYAQNKHIASYLGISPQSLSRLKTNLE